MIFESPIELIKYYDSCGKIERIAEILFDSDDDMFYDEQDREDLRSESVPRIANAIKSLPMQLIALAPTIGEEAERQIAIVPINAYDTRQIANDSPIGEGDDYTYRLCRRWEARCFEVASLDRIGGYLSSRPVVKSIDDLDGIPTAAWDGDGFRLCKPDIVPSNVFAIAPVIIEDGLDEQDELSAVVSIIDVIAMYGFDLAAGDRAKEKAKHNPEAAFKYYLISDSISDAMLINGLNDQLLAVEKKYDMQTTEMENLNLQSELKSWIIVAVALVCLALALVLVVWRYRNRVKMKAQEYELIKSDLDASLSSLENLKQAIGNYESKLAYASTTIQNLNSEYSKVKTELRQNTASETALDEAELKGKKMHADEMRMIVDQQIKVVHQLILWSYEFENDGATFSKKFRQLMTMDSNNSASLTTYWNHLHLLVNDLYDNVLDKAQEMAEGKLKNDEINFLALSCCGFSRTVIMICMGYKNIVSVSNKKAKIARKMNVKSLDTFVADYQSVQ